MSNPQANSKSEAPAEDDRSSTGMVRLVNAVFYGHHGVMQEEHRVGGRYEVDVSVGLDFEDAALHDDLDRTVDYEHVYDFVRRLVTENKFYLIEKLAYRITHRVADAYPDVESVEVTVRKPNPPVGGPCDRAEATYTLHTVPGPDQESDSSGGVE